MPRIASLAAVLASLSTTAYAAPPNVLSFADGPFCTGHEYGSSTEGPPECDGSQCPDGTVCQMFERGGRCVSRAHVYCCDRIQNGDMQCATYLGTFDPYVSATCRQVGVDEGLFNICVPIYRDPAVEIQYCGGDAPITLHHLERCHHFGDRETDWMEGDCDGDGTTNKCDQDPCDDDVTGLREACIPPDAGAEETMDAGAQDPAAGVSFRGAGGCTASSVAHTRVSSTAIFGVLAVAQLLRRRAKARARTKSSTNA